VSPVTRQDRPWTTIRVLLVDDHPIMRAALRVVISEEPDLEVVGEASNALSALAAVRAHRPDVAVVDLCLPGLSGIELIERLRREHPGTRALALTFQHGASHARAVFAAGGLGYVVKDAEPSVLLAALRAVHRGRTFIELGEPEGAADNVFKSAEERNQLTPREWEVLELLAYGHVGREIAEHLHLSVKTVETYRHRLCEKLGLHSRADLVQFAIEHGLLGRGGGRRRLA
jgi:two-component system response regulator NreC